MTELKPALKAQIEKEAEAYGTAMDNCGSVIQSYAKKDYVEGATAYAFKWQEAEEMMERMAATLLEISNGGATPQYKAIQAINLYNNYKQSEG